MHTQIFVKLPIADMGRSKAFFSAPGYTFNPDDPAEVDRLWHGLVADGGAPSRGGWLKDHFGLGWQIVPKAFLQMMSSGEGPRVARVTQAMLQMDEHDSAGLQRAFDGTDR